MALALAILRVYKVKRVKGVERGKRAKANAKAKVSYNEAFAPNDKKVVQSFVK